MLTSKFFDYSSHIDWGIVDTSSKAIFKTWTESCNYHKVEGAMGKGVCVDKSACAEGERVCGRIRCGRYQRLEQGTDSGTHILAA